MAAMNDEQLKIVISAVNDTKATFAQVKKDTAGMSKSVNKLSRGVKKSSRQISESFRSMGAQAKVAFAVIGIAAVAFGKKAVNAASDMEETQSKFNVIFDDIEDQANAWAEEFGRAMGRSEESMKAFTATTGDMLKPLGFATDEAFQLSKAMTALALDVASFTNRQDADVIQSFQRALTGERESLKTLGIVINEADIKMEALRLGLFNGTGEVNKQAKAIATINLLYANTVDAQGDLARTSASYANQMKALTARIEDFMVEFGEKMIPSILVFVDDVMPSVEAALSSFSKETSNAADDTAWLGKTVAITIEIIRNGFNFVETVLTSFGRVIGTVIALAIDSLGTLGEIVSAVFAGEFSKAADINEKANERMRSAGKDLTSGISDDFSSMAEDIDLSVTRITDLYDEQGRAAKKLKRESELKDFAKKDAEENIRNIEEMAEKYKGAFDGIDKAAEKSAEKAAKAFKKFNDSTEKISDSLTGLKKDFRSVGQEASESMAAAVVEQEEKIKSIKEDISGEKDSDRLRSLKKELKVEEAALKEFNKVALGLQKEISEERRRNSLTDFERRIEDLDRQKQSEINKLNEKASALEKQLEKQLEGSQEMRDSDKKTADSTDEMADDVISRYSDMESKVGDSVEFLVEKNGQLRKELEKFQALTAPKEGRDKRTFSDVVAQAGVPDPFSGDAGFTKSFPDQSRAERRAARHITDDPRTQPIVNINNPVIDSEKRRRDLIEGLKLALGRDFKRVTLGSS